jgi:hypothetical protein
MRKCLSARQVGITSACHPPPPPHTHTHDMCIRLRSCSWSLPSDNAHVNCAVAVPVEGAPPPVSGHPAAAAPPPAATLVPPPPAGAVDVVINYKAILADRAAREAFESAEDIAPIASITSSSQPSFPRLLRLLRASAATAESTSQARRREDRFAAQVLHGIVQAGASVAASDFARWSAFLAWASEPARSALLAEAHLKDIAHFKKILLGSGSLDDATLAALEHALPPTSALTSRTALQVCIATRNGPAPGFLGCFHAKTDP